MSPRNTEDTQPAARLLIYGATGYTGRLVAAHAADALPATGPAGTATPTDAAHTTSPAPTATGPTGALERPVEVILAGRDADKLKRLAEPLERETRVFTLDDPARLRSALEDVDVVLNLAGPFSHTARPMVDACLDTRTHYIDINAEIEALEAIAHRDADALRAGVLLLPGVGFDVVAADCLALHTVARVEEPSTLRIALAGTGALSRGTARTLIESLGRGVHLRHNGILRTRAPGGLEQHFDFGAGPTRAVCTTIGSVATAFYSTGVPRIEGYLVVSGRPPRVMRASRWLAPLLRQRPVQRLLARRLDTKPEGPSAEARENGRSQVLVEVEGPGGQRARSLLELPTPYAFTPLAAVEAARRAAQGHTPTGFQTPAMAFGPEFVLEVCDAVRTDLA